MSRKNNRRIAQIAVVPDDSYHWLYALSVDGDIFRSRIYGNEDAEAWRLVYISNHLPSAPDEAC